MHHRGLKPLTEIIAFFQITIAAKAAKSPRSAPFGIKPAENALTNPLISLAIFSRRYQDR
jgi:hypothetical protein